LHRLFLLVIFLAVLSVSACANDGADQQGVSESPGEVSAPAAAADPTSASVVGKAPTAAGLRSIVVLEPQVPPEGMPAAEQAVMDQIQMSFVPSRLIVRTGEPVKFLNSDEELHNINVTASLSREPAFNVAIPTDGIYTHTFKADGFYEVHCDIHPTMTAQIFATSSPYATEADAAGNFAFYDVTPGDYTVKVRAGGRQFEQLVQVKPGRTDVEIAGS
jgi:plastocyanin